MTAVAVVDDLILRAGTYQVLALAYAYPDPDQRRGMQVLLDDLGRAAEATGRGPSPTLDALAETVAGADLRRVEADFNRLFSGQVEAAPHETAFEPDVFRRQRALADIAGFLAAFDVDLPEDSRWQPDHIGVELELCGLLLQRQAHAVEQGWVEQAEVCDDALRAFLEDHLGRWYAAFARQLVRRATTGYYRELARATDAWVREELTRRHLHPEPLADRPRGAADDDAPPVCGGCPAASGVV